MSFHWHPQEQVATGRYLLKWLVLSSIVGVCGGTASAVFLACLDRATAVRLEHPWLLYFLPIAGLAIGLVYHWWGKDCEKGNNLILEEIHDPKNGVSGRMAPLILIATVATHLFGGSAGREGTAVQMGGSLAGWIGRKLRLDKIHTRILLMAGVSAGFGSVFGTPIAGMIFGLEVLAVGRIRYDALFPCLAASLVGDWTCTAWGIEHTHYAVNVVPQFGPILAMKVFVAALAFALVSVLFAETTHWLHWVFKQATPWSPARPMIGAVMVIALVWVAGTADYLGLGIPVLMQSFEPGGVATWAFLWKLIFTAVTLGAGFKGGEVTPLFVIGAALGSTLGGLLDVPTGYMAALGFVAVFAGAANTPLACTVMGIELFGAPLAPSLAIACCASYIWSGHRGIYLSQIVDTPKTGDESVLAEESLRNVRQTQSPITLNYQALTSLVRRLRGCSTSVPLVSPGESEMKPVTHPASATVGLVRIFLSADEKKKSQPWYKRLLSRPLYMDIIDLARKAGLWGATAKGMTSGFTKHGKSSVVMHAESGLRNTQLYVDLIAPRPKLEAFFQQIAPLIDDHLVIYKELECWNAAEEVFAEQGHKSS